MKDKNKKEEELVEIKDFTTQEVRLFMEEDDEIGDAVHIDDFFNADEVDHQHALEEHEEDVKYRVGLEKFSELEVEFYEDVINKKIDKDDNKKKEEE